MSLYNSICKSFPAIKAITGQRKKAVQARWNEHKNLEAFKHLFEIAEASSFLKGFNKRNWKADFDWLMKPDKMVRVLEGSYNNAEPLQQNEVYFDPDSLEAIAMRRHETDPAFLPTEGSSS